MLEINQMGKLIMPNPKYIRKICFNCGRYFLTPTKKRRARMAKYRKELTVRPFGTNNCSKKCSVEWSRKNSVYQKLVKKALSKYNGN